MAWLRARPNQRRSERFAWINTQNQGLTVLHRLNPVGDDRLVMFSMVNEPQAERLYTLLRALDRTELLRQRFGREAGHVVVRAQLTPN